MAQGIGFCGAHRVGKTTLGEAVGQAAGVPFVKTQTSQIFRDRGVDPALPMPFDLRLSVQQDILSAAKAAWEQAGERFVTDRTPLDMAAYTLADVQGTTEIDSAAVSRYLNDCMETANRFFAVLIIVPPGIPLVAESGKAALHHAYIEHIHAIIVGLCHDPRITATVRQIPRETLSLDGRLCTCLSFLTQSDHSPSARP